MYTDISADRNILSTSHRRILLWAIAATLLLVLVACGTGGPGKKEEPAKAEKHGDEHKEDKGDEVRLSLEALTAAKLEYAEAGSRTGGGLLRVVGSVEVNQQQTQQATPLVAGRVTQVYVALGDRVRAGQPLALISSPQIAQLHGKLHEAETKLGLSERELQRVEKAENRAAVLAAKAKLDEAEATLKRTRRLIELGVGAGKDLIAAETSYRTALAEYEFQSNIALNREVQEARAAVETARVDVAHARDELKAYGAPVREGERDDHQHDTSLITLRAPVSGLIAERLVNAGAGIEAGRALFTVANLSSIWVIANVPEAQLARLSVGTPARVHVSALGDEAVSGRVAYIDPQLNEETRTAKVRVELPNPGERLKGGMFAEVEFQTPGGEGIELVVPETAIQRLGERTIVFVAEESEPGHFKVREVELGGENEGFRTIKSGLQAGDRVVTKGSFTLKSQLHKGELGEDHH